MHIKRFAGTSVKDAIKAVKAEFGDNALILNTKRMAPGHYEVTAAVDHETAAPAAQARKASPDGPQPDLGLFIKRELKGIKDLCITLMGKSGAPEAKAVAEIEAEMLSNGIDRRLAAKVISNTVSALTDGRASDPSVLRSLVRRMVASKLSVKDPLDGSRTVAFIGPAGVGKTTTIAKLAAIHALKKKRTVALLTMDTYRIAAAEQLKTYGRIIGLPVEVAGGAAELAALVRAHSDKDIVLIDTAGRSHRNKAHISEIGDIAAAVPGAAFNLVLSSQTRDEALYDAVRGFNGVNIDSLTFTKLDEGRPWGSVINTAVLSGSPVAYLTTGQRVPEDIEIATRERLVDFFIQN